MCSTPLNINTGIFTTNFSFSGDTLKIIQTDFSNAPNAAVNLHKGQHTGIVGIELCRNCMLIEAYGCWS